MAESKKAMYAALGTGSLAVDRAKRLGSRLSGYADDYRKWVMSNYRELVERGEGISRSIRRSASFRRAKEQTKTAQSRVKAATTSVRRAASAQAEAVQTAGKKVS